MITPDEYTCIEEGCFGRDYIGPSYKRSYYTSGFVGVQGAGRHDTSVFGAPSSPSIDYGHCCSMCGVRPPLSIRHNRPAGPTGLPQWTVLCACSKALCPCMHVCTLVSQQLINNLFWPLLTTYWPRFSTWLILWLTLVSPLPPPVQWGRGGQLDDATRRQSIGGVPQIVSSGRHSGSNQISIDLPPLPPSAQPIRFLPLEETNFIPFFCSIFVCNCVLMHDTWFAVL